MNTNRHTSARVHSPLPIGKLGVGCDYSYPIFFSRHFISFQLNPHFGGGFFMFTEKLRNPEGIRGTETRKSLEKAIPEAS